MDLYLPTWLRNDRSLRDAALFKIVTFCFRQRIHFVHGSAFHRLDCGRRPEDECSSLVSTVPGWPSRSDTRVWGNSSDRRIGGSDGTRTRGLLRDRAAFRICIWAEHSHPSDPHNQDDLTAHSEQTEICTFWYSRKMKVLWPELMRLQ
jgi:hypothetical protein